MRLTEVVAIVPRHVGKFGRNAALELLVLVGVTLPAVTGLTREKPPAERPSSIPAVSAPTMDLHRSEVIRFSAPGPVAVITDIKCGPGGDIYAIYSSTRSLEASNVPIRRVSASSRRVTEYPIPAIPGYEKLVRISFDVSADGTLYSLLQGNPQSESKSKSEPVYVYFVVKYKDDGSVDSYFTLGEVPGKKAGPSSLAVFTDGSFLVSGATIDKTPDGISFGVFSALFDQNGVFRAPVTLMKPDTRAESRGSTDRRGVPLKTAQQTAADKEKQSAGGSVLASPVKSFSSSDGNIYVFQGGDKLDIVSPTGSVEDEFELKPPADGLSGDQVAAAGPGFLFVTYDHLSTGEPGEEHRYQEMITVVYPQTGEVSAIYRMPQSEFEVPACAASPKDFLSLSADDQGYLAVVRYSPN